MQESQDSQAEHSWTFSLFSRNDSPKLLRGLISRPSSTSTASQSMSVAECGGGSTVAAVGGESATSTSAAATVEKQQQPQRSHVGTFRKISFTRRSKLRKAMEEAGPSIVAQRSTIGSSPIPIGIHRDFCSAIASDSCDLLDAGTSATPAATTASTSTSTQQQQQQQQIVEAAVPADTASTTVASPLATAEANKSVAVAVAQKEEEAEKDGSPPRPASSASVKKHSVGGGRTSSNSKSARSSRRERERDRGISRDADSAFERGSGPMVAPPADTGNKRSTRKLQRTSSSETEKSASRKTSGSTKNKGKPALQAIHSGEQVLFTGSYLNYN